MGVTFPNFLNTGTSSTLNFALLFGFGNIGIKAGLYYYPGSFSAKVDYTDASIDDITYKISNDTIGPYLNFGYTTELAGKTFMANASFAFYFYTRKEEVTQGSNTTVTNSGYNRIDFDAGATYDFYKTDSMVQSVTFNASYRGYKNRDRAYNTRCVPRKCISGSILQTHLQSCRSGFTWTYGGNSF